jgi:hypothetical protein
MNESERKIRIVDRYLAPVEPSQTLSYILCEFYCQLTLSQPNPLWLLTPNMQGQSPGLFSPKRMPVVSRPALAVSNVAPSKV